MSKLKEKRIINDIRLLALDMIDEAGSGHPGIALDAAPIMYALFHDQMNFDLEHPEWFNRDRFVLSSGHGSALLYATLYATFGELTLSDLKNFRNIYSKTPGHPEYSIENRIDCTTGPLGQGLATAVGMAIGGKYFSTFNTKKIDLFDYKVYALCGDGDLMEGVSYEAAFLAGKYELDNLIVLYDSNGVSLDGELENDFSDKVADVYTSLGWTVLEVKDGEKVKEINKAINTAKKSKGPTLIIVNTVIGIYSKYEGTNKIHGSLEKEDLENIRKELGGLGPFTVDNSNLALYRQDIKDRVEDNYSTWYNDYQKFMNQVDEKTQNKVNAFLTNEDITLRLDKVIDTTKLFTDKTMRDINYQIMNVISAFIPNFMGGSADLFQSTKTYLKGKLNFNSDCYNGRNIDFGVREHAMGAIMNGLALVNIRSFGSTFLTFSDYLKPTLRMSALMDLPTTYIFTHDSILVGQDGATHQPIEQLAMLRTIPNFEVYRPADYKELLGCWNLILNKAKPTALVLPRNHVEVEEHTSSDKVKFGGYVISEVKTKLDLIIIATGSEVGLAMRLKEELLRNYIEARVVSMPNVNLFLKQSPDYQEEVLPKKYKTMVIEFSNDPIWYRFVKDSNDIIGVSDFGKSAKTDDLLKELELDITSLIIKIKNSL
jgi:transketolase